MIAHPFFCLKIGRLKATVRKVSILVRLSFYFPFFGISGKVLLRTARAAENGPQTCGSWCKQQDGECGSSRCGCGILQPSQLVPRDKSELKAKLYSKIRRIWRTGFYINGCSTVMTVTLRRAILKREKEFMTFSLGLIYHSMGYLNHHLVTLSF
jgi:hypothetical protein